MSKRSKKQTNRQARIKAAMADYLARRQQRTTTGRQSLATRDGLPPRSLFRMGSKDNEKSIR